MKKATKLAISVCMLGSLFVLEAAPAWSFGTSVARAAGVVSQSQTAKRMTGVVTGLTMSSLTMRSEDGRTLSFAVADIATCKAEGLSVGDTVDVFFVGSIDGASTDAATVKTVEIVKEAQIVRSVYGTVTDATMNTVAIQTVDGRKLSFGTVDADRSQAKGMSIGDRVRVSYTGTIVGTSTSGVKVTSVRVIEQAQTVHSITGVVTDATMNTIAIRTEDGRELSFGTADADTSDVEDLTIGDTIKVHYTGTIEASSTKGATVVALETITQRPTGKQISGVIVDAAMNTITIRGWNGARYSFGTADAKKSGDGLTIGSWVTVRYTGTIEGTDTSGVTVTEVVQ